MSLKLGFISLFLISSVYSLHSQTPANRYVFDSFYTNKIYTQPATVVLKTLPTTSSTTRVIINISNTIAKVRSTQFGVNATFRNGSDQRTRSSLYNGKVTSLRFPAGSGSNTYFFDGNIPSSLGQYIDQNNATNSVSGINGTNSNYMTPATFINFKKDINGQPIVVINYFYARYGITTAGTRAARVQQAADYAASFVRKMNVTLGGNIKYWEIGNECYGPWEVGYQMTDPSIGKVTGTEYGEDFCVFVQAMKAVDPTIKCGVILNDGTDSWNSLVLPKAKDYADFISVHNYFTTFSQATNFNNILSATNEVADIKSTIQSQIVQYTGHTADYYPIAMTEFNSRGSYNCSMINGLFVSEVLGEIIKNDYGLSCLWVSEWNWDATSLSSMGFVAKADPDQIDYSPRQAYVPYYYYGKCFGSDMVAATCDNANIKAYASKFSSSEVGLVLINKSAKQQEVNLKITDNRSTYTPTTLQWYEFYAGTIDLTNTQYKKFYINGLSSNTNGGGPVNLDTIKPYQSSYDNTKTVSLRPYSVVYMVIKTNDFLTQSIGKADNIVNCKLILSDKRVTIKSSFFVESVHLVSESGVKVADFRLNSDQSFSVATLPKGIYLINCSIDKHRKIVRKLSIK